jgi:hypothetical protein
MSPFADDGHLSELGLELFQLGELDAAEMEPAGEHVADCDPCTTRLTALGEHEASFSLPAPPAVVGPGATQPVLAPKSANNTQFFVILSAVAAALLVAMTVPRFFVDPVDEFRLKGTGVELEVHQKMAQGSRRVRSGSRVEADAHLGFRVRTKKDGHLLVLGIDDADAVYPVFPAQGDAVEFPASKDGTDLDAAIRFDGNPGTETLMAVFCNNQVAYTLVAYALKERRVGQIDGCRSYEVVLHKERLGE